MAATPRARRSSRRRAGSSSCNQSYPRTGRFITDSDDDTRRRVVVLGDKVRNDLKLPEDPDGTFIQLGGEWFKVVGVMEPRGEMFGQSLDNYVVDSLRDGLGTAPVRIASPTSNHCSVVDDLGCGRERQAAASPR